MGRETEKPLELTCSHSQLINFLQQTIFSTVLSEVFLLVQVKLIKNLLNSTKKRFSGKFVGQTPEFSTGGRPLGLTISHLPSKFARKSFFERFKANVFHGSIKISSKFV